MPRHCIETGELSALAHCCMIAGERFAAHAAMLHKLESQGGSPMFTPAAAKRMAEQFEHQAKQAARFREIFSEGEPFAIEISGALAAELEGEAA